MQWNKPKSVRQIGDIPGRGRIYMEDYVIRFAKKLAKSGQGLDKAAVLLGNTYLTNEEKIYQISGIVEIPNFASRTSPALSQDTWNRIYTEIKENFTDLEIIGWYYCRQGFSVKDVSLLLEIHKQNFQRRDKVLYLYEETEKEDSFFLYRNGHFERQKGYYIYYEKNPEMLHYMEKEANRHVHIVEQEDDRVIRNIRGVIEEKEKGKQKKRQKESRMGYSMGVMIALIAILIGAAALKNQTTLEQVKGQLQALQDMALGEKKNSNTTMVETMGSNLARMTAPPAPSAVPSGMPASFSAAAASPAPSVSGTGTMPASQRPVAK